MCRMKTNKPNKIVSMLNQKPRKHEWNYNPLKRQCSQLGLLWSILIAGRSDFWYSMLHLWPASLLLSTKAWIGFNYSQSYHISCTEVFTQLPIYFCTQLQMLVSPTQSGTKRLEGLRNPIWSDLITVGFTLGLPWLWNFFPTEISLISDCLNCMWWILIFSLFILNDYRWLF